MRESRTGQDIIGDGSLRRRRIEPDGSTSCMGDADQTIHRAHRFVEKRIVSAARVGTGSSGGRFKLRTNKKNSWRKTPQCESVGQSNNVRSANDNQGKVQSPPRNQGLRSILSAMGGCR